MSLMTSVLVVDAQPIFRLGLQRMLGGLPGLRVTAEAGTPQQVLDCLAAGGVGLVVGDLLALSGSGSLDVLKDIRIRFPQVRVILCSALDEGLWAERSMRAGVRAWVGKCDPHENLAAAVQAVRGGGVWLSAALQERLIRGIIADCAVDQGKELPNLSDREFDVFSLMGSGYGNIDIARRLNLSVKTINTHKERLKQKLNCDNTRSLVVRAIEWKNRGIAV